MAPRATELTATAGNGQATLTWTAIAEVSGWQVQQDDGDWTAIADSDDQTSEHTVSDLVGGATYTFKVRAVAGTGDTLVAGVASNAVSVTPTVTMDTYTVTHVRIGSGDTGSAAAVAAATKTSTGLGDLTVSVSVGSSNADILAAADALTEHSVTTGSRYIDADGVVWNFASGKRTYWLVESVDTTPSFGANASIADQSLTQGVAYTSAEAFPEADGGDGDIAYAVDNLPSGLSLNAARKITGTATALLAKTEYTYTATDSDETGPDSATLSFYLSVAPKATELTATAGNGEATLTWTAIAEVSGWQVQQDDGDWTAIADSDDQTSEHTVGDLVGGATYTFKVRAVAGSGDTLVEGVASNAVSVTPTVTMDTYTVTHVRIGSGDTGSAAAVAAATKTSTGLGDLTVSVSVGSSNADILAAADALTEHSVTTGSRYIDADGVVWNFASGKRTYWLVERQ